MATKHLRYHFRYELGERVGLRESPQEYTVVGQHFIRRLGVRSPMILYDLDDETGAHILRMAEKHLIPPPRKKRNKACKINRI